MLIQPSQLTRVVTLNTSRSLSSSPLISSHAPSSLSSSFLKSCLRSISSSSSSSFHSSSSSFFSHPPIRRSPSKLLTIHSSTSMALTTASSSILNRKLTGIVNEFIRAFSSSSPLSSPSSSSSSSSSPSLASSLSSLLSSFSSSFQSLSSFVFSKAPRGFGHFDLDDKSPKSDKQHENEKKPQESTKEKQKDSDKESGKENRDKDGKKDSFFFFPSDNNKGGFQFPPTGGGGGGFNLYFMVGAVLVLVLFFAAFSGESLGSREITFQDFRTKYLEQGRVKQIEVNTVSKVAKVMLKPAGSMQLIARNPQQDTDQPQQFALQNQSSLAPSQDYVQFTIGSVESFDRQLVEAQREMGIDPHDYIPVKYISADSGVRRLNDFLSLFMTLVLLGFIIASVSGLRHMSGMMGGSGKRSGGGLFGVGKSPATVIQPGEMTKVKFSDVAGLDEAKVEVMEFVEFLKNKEKFEKLGARVPKGALLVGPPGTGKTLLAKAVAGEASVPFFSISGSDFVEMFVGVGPARVRDLFQQARQSAPCIVFIDEIDAVGRERGRGRFGGGNDERESTLNQMLVEMDGFTSSDGVVVLAATNRQDILDKALLRPGRFDRQINIDKPDLRGRVDIFKVHLKKITVQMSIPELATRLAALTPGMTGADIANLCNEAAIIAARQGRTAVQLEDFERASDRLLGGVEKRSLLVNKKEKELVAYHEAGHAVLGWFLEHANPVLKVTIVPRASGALGFAQSLPNELHLYHQDQLKDMMVMTLGGRAAEEVFFKRVSTGAADDLTKVNDLAKAQVTKFGMSKRLGQIAFKDNEEGFGQQQYSEATAQIIDEEVRQIANAAYERAVSLVQEYQPKVEALAQRLLAAETVNHDVLVEILGDRPFQTDSYLEYVKQQKQAQEDIKKQKEKDQKAVKEKEHKTDAKSANDEAQPKPQAA